jgi:hypothetical protein
VCASGLLFFLEGEDGGMFDGGKLTFRHILVVGVMTPDGPANVKPVPQWTAYKTPGVGA